MNTLPTFLDAFHAHFTRNPNSCVFMGVDKHLDALPDPSRAEIDARIAEAQALLRALEGLERDGLDFDARLDLDLAKLSLESELLFDTYTFNGRTRAQQLPSAGDDISDGVFMMFINDPRPAGERLSDITARLEAVPAYVEALLGRLDTPVERWVDIDLQKIEGLPDLFQNLVGWAGGEGWADTPRLTRAAAEASEALASYGRRLQNLPATPQLHLAPGTAEAIVESRGIDWSLDRIHANARRFLAETGEILEELRGELVARHKLDADTPMAALHTFLNERYRVKIREGRLEDVLTRYQGEREKILSFIQERNLFPVFADQDMKILRTPDFMAPSIPAGAMMSPAPFREGVATSLVYLTLSEELLDEHNELGIPGMMIHEGIPGHHLQLATAARHPSIVRRHFSALEHAEGWTTMLEDYMLDQGYMGALTDEARFIAKRDISRIGARVAIDLFFMTGEQGYLEVGTGADVSDPDPFVAAGSLLKEVTGFTDARVQAELNWYSQERGYPLSYLTGNTLVWDLKRDVQRALAGQRSDLEIDRLFHRTYLQSGNMPVSFLRRVFQHEGVL
jgi:uncharacterized protein (DUF885 family)